MLTYLYGVIYFDERIQFLGFINKVKNYKPAKQSPGLRL